MSAVPGAAAASPRRRTRGTDHRTDQQPAFVLHSYPWRETSLILDVLTRDYGRTALVARGAKRPTSHFRGLLTPFSPLAVSWSGRAEIKTLVRVEWVGGLSPLRGDGLLNAFYCNELLVRLVSRGDPHEGLFFSYARTLAELSGDLPRRERALRGFEIDLLREIGVAPSFDAASDGMPIDPASWYRVDPEHGTIVAEPAATSWESNHCVGGRSVQALAARDLAQVDASQDARSLLQRMIRYHLRGKPLNTHRILADLQRMET